METTKPSAGNLLGQAAGGQRTNPSSSTGSTGALTPTLAQEIAGDTSTIIGLNVIITDADGIVLGSGDLSRVGTFHEASVRVARSQQAEFHTAEQAARLEGVRPGVTLPIMSQQVVVGTVGITGTPKQVSRFGQVVKRQTEILLGESALVWTRLTRERVLEALLRDLLNFDPDDPADVTARARDFGFDLGLARRAVVYDVQAPTSALMSSAPVIRLIREVFSGPQDIACSLSPQRHVILQRQPRPGADEASVEGLRGQIERLLNGRCHVAIGGVAIDETEIPQSYREALTALDLGVALRATSPYDIASMRIEELITAVPSRTRQRVVAGVTASFRNAPDWALTRRTVSAWVESGFVLVRAAEELQIHRNTLVYRLDKIAEKGGLTMHDRRPWLALYLCCVADRLELPGSAYVP